MGVMGLGMFSDLLYAPDRRMTPKLRSFIDFALTTFGPAASGEA